MPLQQQRYGHDIAGEVFFQNLQKILTRSETYELADLLEVYYLCLLLGFAGRYSIGGRGELRPSCRRPRTRSAASAEVPARFRRAGRSRTSAFRPAAAIRWLKG